LYNASATHAAQRGLCSDSFAAFESWIARAQLPGKEISAMQTNNEHATKVVEYLDALCSRIDNKQPILGFHKTWWGCTAAAGVAVGLALGMPACGASDGSDPTTQEVNPDDTAQDREITDTKADGTNFPLASYAYADRSQAQVGDILILTISSATMFHASILDSDDPSDAPRQVNGTYKFTQSGSTKYVRLIVNKKEIGKYAFNLHNGELSLRKVNTSRWITLSKIATECGGFAGLGCSNGAVCIDLPDSCDPSNGGADCAGMCVTTSPNSIQYCGGNRKACLSGYRCEDIPGSGCTLAEDCLGQCVPVMISLYAAPPAPGGECGGLAGKGCYPGMTCVDDPSDDCDPATGGADCMGICQKTPTPPKPENCLNHIDDDQDGFADCLDSDCADEPLCGPIVALYAAPWPAEKCNNAIDDDGDGLVDCDDPECYSSLACDNIIALYAAPSQ
jgi:hypothetical protein